MSRKNLFLMLGLALLASTLFLKWPSLKAEGQRPSTNEKRALLPASPLKKDNLNKPSEQLEFAPRCALLKSRYEDLATLKKNNQVESRFLNIHKKIGRQIYRLRQFFKDGDEGERIRFLVYLEDDQENAHIVEKSDYKKGKLFLKIERAEGEILYREEGLNLNADQFLHYINNQLSDSNGALECHFQQA